MKKTRKRSAPPKAKPKSKTKPAPRPKPPAGVTEIAAPLPREISGVAAVPGGYAVVGDETSKYGFIWPEGGRFDFKGKVRGAESIDVGLAPDGTMLWLILGENRACLADLDGGRFAFPKKYRPRAGRGLEGIALRPWRGDWQVAVCSEGGFFDPGTDDEGKFDKPVVTLLTWVKAKGVKDIRTAFELDLAVPSAGQRFRAADLVWQGDGIVVLLASSDKARKVHRHHWLQAFDLKGKRVGEPLKLEKAWGAYWKDKNWEAMDWTLDGHALVLGHDVRKKNAYSALAVFAYP